MSRGGGGLSSLMRDASGARQFDAITATALLHSVAEFDYWALWPPDAVMETGSPVWHSVQTFPLSVHSFYITPDDRDKRWNEFDRNYKTETCEKNSMIVSRLYSNPWRPKFQFVEQSIWRTETHQIMILYLSLAAMLIIILRRISSN